MTDKIIADWIDSIDDTIQALNQFQNFLQEFDGEKITKDEFQSYVEILFDNGLDDWMDNNPLKIDRLYDMMTTEEQ